MSFRWPLLSLLLGAVPAVLAVHWWSMRRRRKRAVRWSSTAILRTVVSKQPSWKRHLPMALLLAAMGALAVASARPQMTRDVPIERTSVILALDVSQSMCSTDVEPNRLTVAQAAAREFIDTQGAGARMGLVVFAGSAQLVVPPTSDRAALREAIDALTTSRGTAIGAAILKSIDAIAAINPQVEPVGDDAASAAVEGAPGAGADRIGAGAGAEGEYAADVIVVLTDGANTRGISPVDAADIARARGVRVFTIGFGTTNPASSSCTRAQLGAAVFDGRGGGFGGGGFGGGGFGGRGGGMSPLVADDATLQEVADRTGGEHYEAEDAAQLRQVFDDLPSDIDHQTEEQEVTVMFAALGALLAVAAVLASMRYAVRP